MINTLLDELTGQEKEERKQMIIDRKDLEILEKAKQIIDSIYKE